MDGIGPREAVVAVALLAGVAGVVLLIAAIDGKSTCSPGAVPAGQSFECSDSTHVDKVALAGASLMLATAIMASWAAVRGRWLWLGIPVAGLGATAFITSIGVVPVLAGLFALLLLAGGAWGWLRRNHEAHAHVH